MRLILFLSLLAYGLMISAFGQKPTIVFTFSAESAGQHIPLDSIMIENLTQGSDTTLFTPDTALVLEYATTINDNESIGKNSFSVSQNYPNPFTNLTTINIYLPVKEQVEITILDISGRGLAQYKNRLNRGTHSFIFYPGKEKYYVFL